MTKEESIHRGEIVEKVFRQSGYSIAGLARYLKVSRRQIYNLFDNDKLKWEIIRRIGVHIRHDFSKEFRELQVDGIITPTDESMPPSSYVKGSPEWYEYQINIWRNKYIHLLEEVKDLLPKKGEKIS